MPQPLDEAAEAAEFAALVAELKAPEVEDSEESDDSEAAPETDTSGDLEEDEDLEAEEKPEDEEDEDLEDEDEETDDELTKEELAAKKLFESGDIKAACKRLGIDPKIFKINARQFTAMRKGLADAAKFQKEGIAIKSQGEQLQTAAEQTYGPIVAGFQAYKQGNPLNLRSAIELMCEDTFENVVATVARAAKGLDPAQVEVMKLRKELADREAAGKAETTKAQAQAQQVTEVKRITGLLKETPLAKIDGAAEEIYKLVADSYKEGVGYGLTVKAAYAQVKAKHARVAAAFGGKLPTGGKKPPKGKQREELQTIRKDPKKMTKEERQAAEDAEFQASVREAKEAVKRGERSSRRAR